MTEGYSSRRPRKLAPGRIGLYAFLVVAALFFLLPLYVLVITSLKPMDEIRLANIFALPETWTFEPWLKAWAYACTGRECTGVSAGFWNSVQIVVPATIASIFVGALNGYALAIWRPRGSSLLFNIILLGGFVPFQIFIYPLVRMYSAVGIFGSLLGIVVLHIIFGLPVMMLLFRNYYSSLPADLFRAARVDGGSFWSIFFRLALPMSTPVLIVAVILQVTGIWNDYLAGLIFAGRDYMPMTVQLNNIVNPRQSATEYNVNMAATILTALVPLAVYFFSGRWFVRGIAAGAVKG
ncbi:MAG: carbohydrate ABC transporter permease [Bauldia sp.]|nr:carbohydrate ABC transporter permease [Bauldia sp.]